MTLPCDDCAHPEHCTSQWPDDDKHFPGEVRGCFAASARSVGFTSPHTQTLNVAQRAEQRDMAAYKALRKQGIQPAMIYGSGDLAQIDDQHVIERKPDPATLERYEVPSS